MITEESLITLANLLPQGNEVIKDKLLQAWTLKSLGLIEDEDIETVMETANEIISQEFKIPPVVKYSRKKITRSELDMLQIKYGVKFVTNPLSKKIDTYKDNKHVLEFEEKCDYEKEVEPYLINL